MKVPTLPCKRKVRQRTQCGHLSMTVYIARGTLTQMEHWRMAFLFQPLERFNREILSIWIRMETDLLIRMINALSGTASVHSSVYTWIYDTKTWDFMCWVSVNWEIQITVQEAISVYLGI